MPSYSVDRHARSPVSTSPQARAPRGPLRRLGRSIARFTEAVRADHALVLHQGVKYGSKPDEPEDLASALVHKVGLQMLAACRIMRLCASARVPLAPRVVSRLIRHAYGADIHWDAELAPGIMIVHGMGLVVSYAAIVGPGVILCQNVTLGVGRHPETGETGGPTIEENVFIGTGATLLGPITVGAGSKIMPGCVLVRSVPPNSIVQTSRPVVSPRSRVLRVA